MTQALSPGPRALILEDEPLPTGTRNRRTIAILIYSMTNAVIFGAGLITLLNVSALQVNAHIWIPVVVIASLILARLSRG